MRRIHWKLPTLLLLIIVKTRRLVNDMDEAKIVSFSDSRQHESIKKKEQYSHVEWVEVISQWVVRGNVKHTSWVVLALFPGLPRFILWFASREVEECEKHVLY